MDMEEALLRAIQEEPGDETPWLALADWLDERGDPRAEVVRLQQILRRAAITPERGRGRRSDCANCWLRVSGPACRC
jgi:uncharacterized protein (TIGR02996 family)